MIRAGGAQQQLVPVPRAVLPQNSHGPVHALRPKKGCGAGMIPSSNGINQSQNLASGAHGHKEVRMRGRKEDE